MPQPQSRTNNKFRRTKGKKQGEKSTTVRKVTAHKQRLHAIFEQFGDSFDYITQFVHVMVESVPSLDGSSTQPFGSMIVGDSVHSYSRNTFQLAWNRSTNNSISPLGFGIPHLWVF